MARNTLVDAGFVVALLSRRGALQVALALTENAEPAVKLIEKYSKVSVGFADACLVRMSLTLADPIILMTDQDF
jgi:hypothetical protein